ncbi:Peptidase M16 inactive domain protein [Cesiribacter andamanensis AMV16]|uniref:Peptidase M16 inactive domain protein n=2 Tax=Cesiribacter TaxID=1133570 RepID=M7N239_9BACT|nr:Peptidase M16 inactive domain protein [Cesiribacter andamanensis AMV16]
MLEPRWDEQEFARLKQAQLNRIQQAEANPDVVASDIYNKLLYGPEHIMAKSLRGTKESLSAISLDDLKAYYQANFSPSVASYHLVGMVDREGILEALQPLAQNWQAKTISTPTYTAKAPLSTSALYFVDVPGAKQSVIRIGRLADMSKPENYIAANVVNYHLGAGSGGLLFRILREEKGYTYGAYSGFSRYVQAPGSFTASSSVQSNVTKEAVETFKTILEQYGENYGEAELEKTKQALLRQDARAYETPYQKLSVLHTISTFNMPKDYMQRNQSLIRNMDLQNSKALIRQYMNPSQMVFLVVGDAQSQLSRMSELGLGKPIVLDRNGAPAPAQKAHTPEAGKKAN